MSHEFEFEDDSAAGWQRFNNGAEEAGSDATWPEETGSPTAEPELEAWPEPVAEEGDPEEFAEEDFSMAPAKPVLYGRRNVEPTGPAGGGKLPSPRVGWDGQKGRKLVKPDEIRLPFSPQERLLILDTWQRSGLPAGDFAPLVGLSKHTLYLWKKRFVQYGPAGLTEQPRGPSQGSKLSEVTKRTIVMLKQTHPEWGCQRISDELMRGPALAASASAVARVLHEAGYQLEERVTQPHPDKERRFERASPNQLWQTDLFTFVLKRQNRRLHLVGFMDDHSRFIVGYGLHASASSALVLEVLRAAIASYGLPQEILTDKPRKHRTETDRQRSSWWQPKCPKNVAKCPES